MHVMHELLAALCLVLLALSEDPPLSLLVLAAPAAERDFSGLPLGHCSVFGVLKTADAF